jgi:hypothetical protein
MDTTTTTVKTIKPRKKTAGLFKSLQIASNEKDVENAYRAEFNAFFPSHTCSPFKVDGLLQADDILCLIEFKHNQDLKSKMTQCGVLLQCIFYLKRFQEKGAILPKSIFVGDINECFCLSTADVLEYLMLDIDWKTAPSSVATAFPEVVQKMVTDPKIKPFVYDVDEKFDLGIAIEKLRAICSGKAYAVQITRQNIPTIFAYFQKHVVVDKSFAEKSMFTKDEEQQLSRLADIFFNCLTDKNETFLHPKKKNILVSKGVQIGVNGNLFRSFFAHFKQDYSPKELEELVASKDRILEETKRRREGAFFTPSLWVDEAHKMITEALGANWKDEYVVWDCASGTNNLTRDYNFKELYCSTLAQGDVDTVKDMGYNKGSTVFQYDFLNDDEVDVLGPKIPEGLRKAFEQGKKILFFINPPYGASGTDTHNSVKAKVGNTSVNTEMTKNTMGHCSRQLYSQFMYKIAKLTQSFGGQVFVSIFAPPLFISGQSFSRFRELWYRTFGYKCGMLFEANNFADVANDWGISFTVWGSDKTNEVLSGIELDVKHVAQDTFQVVLSGKKSVYCPLSSAVGWCGNYTQHRWIPSLRMSSAINVKYDRLSKNVDGAIGWMLNKMNSVYVNVTSVAMFSVRYCDEGSAGVPILEDNFARCIALYCARKTIDRTWLNWQDEYLVPNTEHPDYAQWNDDAIVYSLFNAKSNQSSLRQIDYKGKKWDIRNQFFFMSNAEVKELANKNGFNDMYQDAKAFPDDSYVYKLLEKTTLSPDAKAVLEAARELVRKSMSLRQTWHDENPQYHLASHDAGWAQLKPLLKQNFKEEYASFVALYKKFEDRMREGVYAFGFLKR